MGSKVVKRDDWTRVRFCDVVEHIAERVEPRREDGALYVGLEHLDSGSLEVKRWGSETDLVGTKLRMRKGDILFARRNAYLRRVAIAPHDGLFSAHGMVLRPKGPLIEHSFLPFFMQSDQFMARAEQISVGSLSPTINWTTLRDQEFDLPPISEQSAIAAVLKCGSELYARCGDAIAGSRQACRAFASKMFGDDNEPVPFRELAEVQVGFPFPSSDYAETGMRLLRCSNVGVNRIDWAADITRCWPQSRVPEVEDYLLHKDDIVIALDRPFISEGFKVARLKPCDVPSLLLQRVGRVRLKPGANPGFLWAYLHSRRFQQELQRVQQGTHLPHISRFDIEGATLPRSAINRQDTIAEHFACLQDAQERLVLRRITTQALLESVAVRVGVGPRS